MNNNPLVNAADNIINTAGNIVDKVKDTISQAGTEGGITVADGNTSTSSNGSSTNTTLLIVGMAAVAGLIIWQVTKK